MPYKSKEDQAKSSRNHYAKYPDKVKARAATALRKARKRNKEFIRAYLEEHPCVDCDEADPIVLEFDHVRGQKRKEVTQLAARGCAVKTIEAEIAKCEVRCANCHRRRTVRMRT